MMDGLDSHELQAIRAKLVGFDPRCESITALLGDKRHLSGEERGHVEKLYRSLKDDLKRELTDAEERFYAPAAQAPALALAPANSNPITSNWFSALYDAQIEFAQYTPKLVGA